MHVLAALSGGVDSAVAAARAVDAGHDVTAVHLALSRHPRSHRDGARGCCSLEDSRDARRVADVIGIPFYVWDVAEEFAADVVDDFVAEYAAGRTPNPCLRCNESIKFTAVLERGRALGFDTVCTGHYARLVDGPQGRELHRAVDVGKDQSYVLAVLDAAQLAGAMFPLGDSQKSQVRIEAAERGLLVADKPDSHDICFIPDGDTAGWLAQRLGPRPGDVVDAETGARSAATRVRTRSPSDSAAASASASRPPAVHGATSSASTRAPARCRSVCRRCSTWTRSTRRDHAGAGRRRARGARCSPRCAPTASRSVRWCARSATAWWSCSMPCCAASPPARRWCSTPGTGCSGRPPSTAPPAARPGRRGSVRPVAQPSPAPEPPAGVRRWPAAAATAVGSMPGTDVLATARVVRDSLAGDGGVPHLAELPARGPGADMVGRALSLLQQVWPAWAAETTPTGWRLCAAPGREARRAASYLTEDLDVLEEVYDGWRGPLVLPVAGPWTLAAAVELPVGERLLRDPRAIADLVQSWAEAAAEHAAAVRRRVPGAAVVLQADEPALAAVLGGDVPTASGAVRHHALDAATVRQGLQSVVARLAADGLDLGVHCCASAAPVRLLREAGAAAVGVDVALLTSVEHEQLAECVEAGLRVGLGVVPVGDPGPEVTGIVQAVTDLASRLGFPLPQLVGAATVSPPCGLATASPDQAAAALRRAGAVGRALRDVAAGS